MPSRGPAEVPSYAEYLVGWRRVHNLEPDRMTGGFVEWYLRLPYTLARPLVRRQVSPHAVTFLGLLLSLASILPYVMGGRWTAAAAAAIVAGGVCDQLDGCVAVLRHRESAFGAVWDATVDRVSDLALLAGPAMLLERDGNGAGMVALATFGAALFLLEYVRARSHAAGFIDRQLVTPAERPTRVVLCAVLALATAASGESTASAIWGWSAAALSVLTTVSVVMLLRDAARRVGRDPTTPTTPASG